MTVFQRSVCGTNGLRRVATCTRNVDLLPSFIVWELQLSSSMQNFTLLLHFYYLCHAREKNYEAYSCAKAKHTRGPGNKARLHSYILLRYTHRYRTYISNNFASMHFHALFYTAQVCCHSSLLQSCPGPWAEERQCRSAAVWESHHVGGRAESAGHCLVARKNQTWQDNGSRYSSSESRDGLTIAPLLSPPLPPPLPSPPLPSPPLPSPPLPSPPLPSPPFPSPPLPSLRRLWTSSLPLPNWWEQSFPTSPLMALTWHPSSLEMGK